MQAINGIQVAMINTNANVQVGMVVDAANAHRSYRPSELRPVSLRPDFEGTTTDSTCPSDLKQGLLGATGPGGSIPSTMCHGRTWRLDSRHLPETAWAMLVLNRSLCG
ncbi:MAG: hypothetical protein JWP89_79 [Schlesneria sp.]|jgi:hypothetical protein|nr:hypothetical protein [Schlesneria sp.]